MTLDQALAYLETTARVSCPQITCEQAAEIAELIRSERLPNEWLRQACELARRQRDEAEASERKFVRERDDALTQLKAANGQLAANEEVQRVMREMIEAANKERDEALAKLREMKVISHQKEMGLLARLRDDLCRLGQCEHFVCDRASREIEVGEDCDASDYERPGR